MRFPFWASVLTLCGIAILCSLGAWQMQRLAWKNDLIKTMRATYESDDPREILRTPELTKLAQEGAQADGVFFRRGAVRGEYLHDRAIFLASKVYDGNVGAHVVTPFLLDDGLSVVLVNRGWVPLLPDAQMAEQVSRPQGMMLVRGVMRSLPKTNMFTPANDVARGAWYSINAEDIKAAKGLDDIFSGVFIAEPSEERGDKAYPVPLNPLALPANNHAQYALFWFAMAFVLGGVYVVRFRRRFDA